MERERERSLGREGSLGRPCDLHGAELVQVAERQLSQIQHVHGYVTHSHITPAQVTHCGRLLLSVWLCISMHTNIYLWSACWSHLFLEHSTHTWCRVRQVWSVSAVCLSIRIEPLLPTDLRPHVSVILWNVQLIFVLAELISFLGAELTHFPCSVYEIFTL